MDVETEGRAATQTGSTRESISFWQTMEIHQLTLLKRGPQPRPVLDVAILRLRSAVGSY